MINMLGQGEKVALEVLADLVGLRILSRPCLVVLGVAIKEASSLTLVEIKVVLGMPSDKVEEGVEENSNSNRVIKMRISKDRENLSPKKST
jgi:hypothetical protein